MSLKYTVVFLLAFIIVPGHQLKELVGMENNSVSETQIRTNYKHRLDTKQVNTTENENPNFKRKYKSKCTEVATAYIPDLGIIHYCKFTERSVLIEEKSGTFAIYFHCPERGPPSV